VVYPCRTLLQHLDNSPATKSDARHGVSWNTASDAILAADTELLIDNPDRLEGVTTIGVDEHVVRHEALLYRMEVGDRDCTFNGVTPIEEEHDE